MITSELLQAKTPASSAAVRVSNLEKRYGGVIALNGVSIDIAEGSITGIIGPNGAGKSTFFDLLNGIVAPSQGSVTIHGVDIARLAPHQVASLGVARTFQRTAVFAQASVIDNLRFGRHLHLRHTVLDFLLKTNRSRREQQSFEQAAEAALALTGLLDLRNANAGILAYGQQRRLAIAIALMSEPRVLLLDEPAAGMNAREKEELVTLLRCVAPGRTLVVVEHDMTMIAALCETVLVLIDGRLVVQDRPDQVFAHPQVIEAYLGSDDE